MIHEDLRVPVEVGDAQLVEGDVLVQLERRLLLTRGRRVERPHPDRSVRVTVFPGVRHSSLVYNQCVLQGPAHTFDLHLPKNFITTILSVRHLVSVTK